MTRLFIGLGEGKRESVLEDITVVETECILDIDRALAFDAGAAVARFREAVVERLRQPGIETGDESRLRALPHLVIVPGKQGPWCIDPKKGQGVKTLGA